MTFKISLIVALSLGQAMAQTQTKVPSLVIGPSKVVVRELPKSAYDLTLFASPYVSWGILEENQKSSINLKEAWSLLKKQKDIVVAVVDTGIDYQHDFLKNNITLPRGPANSGNYGVDFSKGAKDRAQPIDLHGHGTHIAGVIKSVMPDVKILPLKYYNPEASDADNLKSTVDALEYAIEQNVDIINYSSGGPGASLEELRVLKKAEEKGILVVAAAGNRSSDIDNQANAYYPASYGLSNIITVINHDVDGHIGPSSNYGKNKADISAPGTRIKSSMPSGRSGFLTGTSQATAFVSGVAALIKAQYPDLSFREIKSLIVQSARPNAELKEKCLAGGMLDAGHALAEANRLQDMKKLQRKIANFR